MFLIAEDIVEGMAVTPAQAESLWVLTLLNKRFCDGAFACPLLRGVLGSDAQVMAAHVQGTGAYFSRSLGVVCRSWRRNRCTRFLTCRQRIVT